MQINLTAPRRAVEPALLAQRLPKLAAALRACTIKRFELTAPTSPVPSTVQVFAAQLGVQRNHVSLENFPALSAAQRSTLQTRCAQWCEELDANLTFTATAVDENANNGFALGYLNVKLALLPPAQFIGRDVATALPKTPPAKALRQLFNASQMALHQNPVQGSPVNSLWFANTMTTDALGVSYLHGGLSAWWDSLPEWDAVQACALDKKIAQNTPFKVCFVGADYDLNLDCMPKVWWNFWHKNVDLTTMMKSLALEK